MERVRENAIVIPTSAVRRIFVMLVVLILLVVLVLIARTQLFRAGIGTLFAPSAAEVIDRSAYQSVFLVNGSSYYGKLAPQVAQAGELEAGSVIDDRLLVEGDVRQEGPRIVQAAAVIGIGRDGPHADEEADVQERAEEEEGEEDGRATDRGAPPGALRLSGTPVALAPRQAGLHVGVHDSMGEWRFPLSRAETTRRPVL